MGFFSKIKNSITGGAASVSIEYPTGTFGPGDKLPVKVTVISQSSDQVKSNGVYVDLKGYESGSVKTEVRCDKCQGNIQKDVKIEKKTFDQAFPVSGAFNLQPKETKVFEAQVLIPPGSQPTYMGSVKHEWSIRGRLEAFGNDPDSGFQTIVVK